MLDLGEKINHKRVARIKRENALYPKLHKAFVVTTDSTYGKAISSNHLNRQFSTAKPNEAWVSDITYIHTLSGWAYLAVIIDLYSHKTMGREVEKNTRAGIDQVSLC